VRHRFGTYALLVVAVAALSTNALVALVDAVSAPVAAAAGAWSTSPTPIANGASGISCPTTTFCMVVDRNGNASVFDGVDWTQSAAFGPGHVLTAVSCSSASFCTAVDDAGFAYQYNAGGWSSTLVVPGGTALRAVACVASLSCLAAGDAGQSFSFDPGSGLWSGHALPDPTSSGTAVSCIPALSCLVGDDHGGTWDYLAGSYLLRQDMSPGHVLTGISCVATSLIACRVVDDAGNAFTTDGLTFGVVGSPNPSGYSGVSCTDSSVCVQVDVGGEATVLPDAITTPLSSSPLTAVSCASSLFCVAVDAYGDAFVYDARQATALATVLGGGGTSGTTITVPTGVGVSDSAALTGATPDAQGVLHYRAYSDAACAQPIASFDTLVLNGVPVPSAVLRLTSPGTYRWVASYSGDDNNSSATSGCGSELEIVQRPNLRAVVQISVSPSLGGATARVGSPALRAACSTLSFESVAARDLSDPRWGRDRIDMVLDANGNANVAVVGTKCAAGSYRVTADLTGPPYLTASSSVSVVAPTTLKAGVTVSPAKEVLTGNTPASGDANYTGLFVVSANPVYAGQTVQLSSAQLASRCGGLRWESNATSGVVGSSATASIDQNGNAAFLVFGAHCASGDSKVTAVVLSGTHPTYSTTATMVAPTVVVKSTKATMTIVIAPQRIVES
jgi:hypothetical protein